MSSREPFPFGTVDVLITKALQAETRDRGPSPNVWRRIRYRAKAWAVRHHLNLPLGWGAIVVRLSLDEFFSQEEIYHHRRSHGWDSWRRDPLIVRFLDYGGLLFRFGW
jgi:hypothetical protein